MVATSFEHADEVRAALRAIVADPAHGPDALSNPRVMASLLSDLLPDAPRESGLLATAVQKNVAGMLKEHALQGLDAGVAVSLAASSFASSTAFTAEACDWVTAELAIALGLADPDQPGPGGPRTGTEIAATARVSEQEVPAPGTSQEPPEVSGGATARPHRDSAGPAGQPPASAQQAPRPSVPGTPPHRVPQPPRDSGWKLATPLPGPYGTRDCPRCGRIQSRAGVGKPHTSPGRLWCPGVPGIEYIDRGGYLRHVTSPDDQRPEQAEEQPDSAPSAPQSPAASRLAEVARLHAAGLLTDQEFQDKRREIIQQLTASSPQGIRIIAEPRNQKCPRLARVFLAERLSSRFGGFAWVGWSPGSAAVLPARRRAGDREFRATGLGWPGSGRPGWRSRPVSS